MSDNNLIDWTTALEPEPSVSIVLSDAELNTPHAVFFRTVRSTEDGFIVASVDCDTLEGDTLWLRGKFGPQNGLHSLVNAADGGENIEGNTYTYTRVESENSPAGYAHRWTV